MSDCFEDIDLVFDTDYVFGSHAFFINQFHSYFFTCGKMHGYMNFSEAALAYIFT
jgi:hypothetical protein